MKTGNNSREKSGIKKESKNERDMNKKKKITYLCRVCFVQPLNEQKKTMRKENIIDT